MSAQKRVIVSGYFGAGNIGDDLLLSTVLEQLASIGVQAVVAAHDGAEVQRVFGVPAFNRKEPQVRIRELRKAAGVVLGPGGLWNDYGLTEAGGLSGLTDGATSGLSHALQIAVEAYALGIPVIGLGLGVGPLRSPDSRALIRLASRVVDAVYTRDDHSYSLLRDGGFREEQVHTIADLAFLTVLERAPERLPVLAINLREWLGGIEPDWLDDLAEFTVELVRSEGLRVVAVPAQDADIAILESLGARLSNQVPFSIAQPGMASVKDTLSSASLVVSMRLHVALLAHRYGIPTVGLAYDDKVSYHFETVGTPELALELPLSRQSLVEAVTRARDSSVLDRSAKAVQACLTAAARGARALTSWAAALPELPAEPDLSPVEELRPDSPWLIRLETAAKGRDGNEPAYRTDTCQTTGSRQIRLTSSAPRSGDEAFFRLKLPRTEQGLRVTIALQAHYTESPRQRGRMAHFVRLDGLDVLMTDIAHWADETHGTLLIAPGRAAHILEVGTRAIRDCEAWQWGHAGRLSVTNVSVEESPVDHADHSFSVPPSKRYDHSATGPNRRVGLAHRIVTSLRAPWPTSTAIRTEQDER